MHGKNKCPSKQIPEDVLNETVLQVLSLEELNRKVAKIIVSDHQQLTILLKEEDPVIVTWKHKSRSESWTLAMKEKARQRAMKGKKDNEENNSHSTND